jgi:hypothetical protein
VTLPRLLLAWLPVAVVFAVAPPLGYRWTTGAEGAAPAPPTLAWTPNRWEVWWRMVEAAVVTMFASLWFDTLGAGGWWVLFLLVGLLVAFPRRLVMWPQVEPARRRVLLMHGGLDVARYLVAGALLAWRLGGDGSGGGTFPG